MSQSERTAPPSSPETQSAEVRQELDQTEITHQGTAVPSSSVEESGQTDSQQYMGASDDNVTPIRPPVAGPADLTGSETSDDLEDEIDPSQELTPG